ARSGRTRRVGLALLAFLVLALGRFGPFGHVLHGLAASFRYPAKLAFPFVLGVALLAAHGLDALPRRGLAVALAGLGGGLLVSLNLVAFDAFAIDTKDAPYVDAGRALAALVPRLAHAAIFALGAAALA